MKEFVNFSNRIKENVCKVIVGKEEIVDLLTVSLICGGHILLEDVPGLGKTTLVKAFSRSLGLNFKRIQFTPDLMPSDLTGINYYNQKSMEFEFKRGPIFTNILLSDEINRATPRTQSSLLEAMEEKQVSVDGSTYPLEKPFMVLATQNPIESFGTFPLPEAQLDRFLMRISLGYPTKEEEKDIIKRYKEENPLEELNQVVTKDEIEYVQRNFKYVKASDEVLDYILDLIEFIRNSEEVILGASPRATLSLFKASQAYAAINGRNFIIPEDVKFLAPYVLNHRIITKTKSKSMYSFVLKCLDNIKVPLEEI
ncbi:AAA family ATPase [Caloramator proteoclasticus]|uniref:MoxR-like ATPase n=1 Tax=Caloramator proteoclasticus DSM 10124 TaxID=1121262 RepID=A0A1M4YRG2_9CLOT|nr:MoxR family ATPase [Caloramator proteoclasticus]SHF08278.1 MoxR-like ATPase [Caloramator proteoclasticus DSM 10124]